MQTRPLECPPAPLRPTRFTPLSGVSIVPQNLQHAFDAAATPQANNTA
jgi:hypothetical protein